MVKAYGIEYMSKYLKDYHCPHCWTKNKKCYLIKDIIGLNGKKAKQCTVCKGIIRVEDLDNSAHNR